MKIVLITILIGVIAGLIDIIPMIKMKIDKYSVVSAFIFYLIVPFIIFNTDLFGMAWWLKGGIITLALAAPVIILVSKEGKKTVLPMVGMSVVLGTLIGCSGYLIF